MQFVEQAQTARRFDRSDGMALALEAILVSPHFLFRIEPAGALDDFQFASRLSYFLWSSMPDDELFQLALDHRLRDPEVLRAQIHRMLLDPKSRALVENFGGQWLETRNLSADPARSSQIPPIHASLRHDMQRETQLFFQSIIRDDRPISDFLAANYTFLNRSPSRVLRHCRSRQARDSAASSYSPIRTAAAFSLKPPCSRSRLIPRARRQFCAANGFSKICSTLLRRLRRPTFRIWMRRPSAPP